MIDIHSHILPGMDDGSKSVEESVKILSTLKSQGVTTSVFTPHFYAFKEDPERFLQRRSQALEKLKPVLKNSGMDIRLGAEVHFYTGISNSDLSPFLITGTDIILVEMPFGKWDERTVNEIIDLSERCTVVLAHIERYFKWQPFNRPVWAALEAAGVLFQINCSSLLDGWGSWKILKLVAQDKITFLASDAHNMDSRPPLFDDAIDVLNKKLSEEQLEHFLEKGQNVFDQYED